MKKINLNALVSILLLSASLVSCSNTNTQKAKQKSDNVKIENKVKKELVTFEADDELLVTADLYTHENIEEAPFIILFHQAGYSRGEYIETADKFLELGFNVMAVDQRSGGEVNGVVNETHKRAVEAGLPTEYMDAMPDLEGAVNYVRDNFDIESLYILGSSYSATLAIVLSALNPDMVDGVLAFSPGEYFEYDERRVVDYAAEIMTPVFITSAKSEYDKWANIFESIIDDSKVKYIPEVESIHGSRALWEGTEGNKECWKAVEAFLSVE
ncbi:MAG: alpha/beta hydrolase [Salinivirgaceae bacterium]|jgi:pimeloyl-ACP methyl ester carboxylesterase|nr:alpha/beta hydrolase [Salinivirgaceae bacterium]